MNVSTSTVATRRRRAGNTQSEDQENASELQLGPEFQLDQIDHQGQVHQLITLNVSEARILIRAALKERRDMLQEIDGSNDISMKDDGEELDDETLAKMATAPGANEVLRKTLDHLSTFARFKDDETTTAAEALLKSNENAILHPFEVAQLGSLACEDVDEVTTLIPSLNNKRDDIDLQRILDELNRLETSYS